MSIYEQKLIDFMRRGDAQKVRWMKNIEKTILPSQIKRIKQKDKTVLMEMVIPKWVDWNLLYDWVSNRKNGFDKICILCDLTSENGIHYLEKHICESCFLKLKHLQ